MPRRTIIPEPLAVAGSEMPPRGEFAIPRRHDLLANRRVVVTGAAGFIGSHLVDALAIHGTDVVALDRRPLADNPDLATQLSEAQVKRVTADMCTAKLADVVQDADTVFHLAAVPGVRSSWGPEFVDYVNSNVLATQRLLRACEHAGVRRLVVASSSSVYGETSAPSRESDPTAPLSPYGVTKLAAEQLCLAHAARADTELSVVALRYFTVYGPRQRPGMAINQVLLGALTGAAVPLYGNGRQRREFTYVSDVVAATLEAGTADVRAAVINVGGGSSVTLDEVVALAQEITGSPVPLARCAEQAGDVPTTEADLTVARRLLDYTPRVELREGMARQAAWLADLPEPVRRSMLRGHKETVPCSR